MALRMSLNRYALPSRLKRNKDLRTMEVMFGQFKLKATQIADSSFEKDKAGPSTAGKLSLLPFP